MWPSLPLNPVISELYTGCKKIRIQTLRVCRGDKMKPFGYVTNI